MKKLLLTTLLLTSTLAQASKTPAEYWNSTSLSWAVASQLYVNNDNCKSDQSKYVACVRALQAAVATASPATLFVPKSYAAELAAYVRVQKGEYGPFVELELVSPDAPYKADSIVERFNKFKAAGAKELSAIQANFAKGATSTDFDSLSARIYGESVTGSNESLASANAINAYLNAAFDPHTYIISMAEMEDMQSGSDSFVGIGATLQVAGTAVKITEPLRGGPAAQAGIKAGDIVVAIDGTPVKLDSPSELGDVVKRLRGVAGTSVKVTVERKKQNLDITIVRGAVSVANVESRIVEDGAKKLGYIRLRSFVDPQSCNKITTAIFDLSNQGAKGLILDLRGNGGGLIDQAVCIGGLFVGRKKITELRALDGSSSQPYVSGVLAVTNLPLITLIDAGSASASELLSGALQDYQASWILGERSFGKGSAQAVGSWSVAPSEILIAQTRNRFYQPSGRTNQSVGIMPDFEVAIKPDATAEDRFAEREADMYTNALPPVGKPWVQPRPAAVAKIADCVRTQGQAIRNYGSPKDDTYAPDYQLYVAEDVLACQR